MSLDKGIWILKALSRHRKSDTVVSFHLLIASVDNREPISKQMNMLNNAKRTDFYVTKTKGFDV